jgi:hypothetical protein
LREPNGYKSTVYDPIVMEDLYGFNPKTVYLFRGRRRGRGCGLAVDGVRFHQFGAGSVRIEEVGLSLAVDAETQLDGMIVSFEVRPGLQRLYTCCRIRNLQTKMMRGSLDERDQARFWRA